MKKNIIFSILLLLLVVFNIFIGLKLWSAIEDNDDFAPYTEKKLWKERKINKSWLSFRK